jgi:hypothetical protein
MAKIRGPADKAAPATPPQSAAQLFQSGAFKEINITTSVSHPGETQVHVARKAGLETFSSAEARDVERAGAASACQASLQISG